MRRTINQLARQTRFAGVIIGICCIGIATSVVQIVISLPWGNYTARFWDCSALIQGIQNDRFLAGHSAVVGEYAILKFGYAVPYWYLYRWIGDDATLVLGAIWFLVLCLAPVISPLFRQDGRIHWAGYLVYLLAICVFPFSHKYIGMTNPTIQSTALWMLLALFYDSRSQARIVRGLSGLRVIPGMLIGALILTDYKWVSFCLMTVIGLELIEAWTDKDTRSRYTLSLLAIRVLDRIILTVLWAGVVVTIAAMVNDIYLRSVLGYVLGPRRIEAFRWGISGNFIIFLWVLGGFWFVLWALSEPFMSRRWGLARRSQTDSIAMRLIVIAGIIVAGFSVVLWPRSARMFAPAVALLFCYGGWRAHALFQKIAQTGRLPKLACATLILVVLGMLVQAPKAGENDRLPPGVDKAAEFITSHQEDLGTGPFGCYELPVFSYATGDSVRWVNLLVSSPPNMDWIVTSDFLGQVVIDEIDLESAQPRGRAGAAAYSQRRLLDGSIILESFSNDFYTSPYYICETNYTDRGLYLALRRGSGVQEPRWDLRYIGTKHGRPLPEVTK